jgi:hypothetical protein
MNTVDRQEASRVAKEKADRELTLMYPGSRANTPEAHRIWSRIFWSEYMARVSPKGGGDGRTNI